MIQCKKCSTINKDSDKFCQNCDAALDDELENKKTDEKEEVIEVKENKDDLKSSTIIVIIILTIIPAAILGAAIFGDSISNNNINKVEPLSCVYTYSDWSDCLMDGTQSRKVLDSTSNCVGTPEISRKCTDPCSIKNTNNDISGLKFSENLYKTYSMGLDFDLPVPSNDMVLYGVLNNTSQDCYASLITVRVTLEAGSIKQEEDVPLLWDVNNQTRFFVEPNSSGEYKAKFKVFDSLVNSHSITSHSVSLKSGVSVKTQIINVHWEQKGTGMIKPDLTKKINKTKKTFHGYDCSDDCSGHEAGYEWAEENEITDEDNCDGKSDSFIEGCKIFVREN